MTTLNHNEVNSLDLDRMELVMENTANAVLEKKYD